jgi:hypothetical protein
VLKRTVDVTGPDTLEVGQQSTFTAVLKDSDDKVIDGKTFIWSSSDPSKATVNPATGLVTGLKAGTVSISASSDGYTGKSSVKVFEIEIAVSGPTLLEVGQTATYSAQARDGNGAAIPGKVFAWTSSDPLVATVSTTGNDGVATAKGIGSFTLSASSEGRSGKSASVKTYGLEARGGTYNEAGAAAVGTVVVRKLRDATGETVKAESTGTLSGPAGWNGNLPLNLKYEADRASSSEILDKVVAVGGIYQASVTLPGQGGPTYKASFNLDANQKLEPPSISVGTLSSTSVPLSWTAVVGAKSYTVNLRQATAGSAIIGSASFDSTVTSHTFSGSGLGLSSGGTYKLEVRASTRNPSSGDPLPEQVNISAQIVNIVIP